MYNGQRLTYALGFRASANDFYTMLPSNLSGPGGPDGIPPAGTPNYYVQQSLTSNVFRVRKFTAGRNCGAGAARSVRRTPWAAITVIPQLAGISFRSPTPPLCSTAAGVSLCKRINIEESTGDSISENRCG